ncbi:MAG: hypothetical protein KBD37_03255 [Burkholderiales bacterium]|nr:hypothetical protein [Burkholderiales bacterium]
MELTSLFRNPPTSTQFLNRVSSCNTHSQSMVDSIASLFESIKNNVGSLFGYEPPLKEHELNALASLISLVNENKWQIEVTDNVKISLGDKVINITQGSTSTPLIFKTDTELRSFYTNCAKRYLRDSGATTLGKENMNAFLMRHSLNPEDRVNAIQYFINNSESESHNQEQKTLVKGRFNDKEQYGNLSAAEKVCVNILMSKYNPTDDKVLGKCYVNLNGMLNSNKLSHQESQMLSHFLFYDNNMVKQIKR